MYVYIHLYIDFYKDRGHIVTKSSIKLVFTTDCQIYILVVALSISKIPPPPPEYLHVENSLLHELKFNTKFIVYSYMTLVSFEFYYILKNSTLLVVSWNVIQPQKVFLSIINYLIFFQADNLLLIIQQDIGIYSTYL